jgi:hypothetical protein
MKARVRFGVGETDGVVWWGQRPFEADEAAYPSGRRYRVRHWPAVAVFVVGRLLEESDQTVWSGLFRRSEWIGVVMVGDDTVHLVEHDDLVPIERGDYCGVCGQVGCAHDGRDDDDTDEEVQS